MRALPFLLMMILAAGLPGCRKREQPPAPKTTNATATERPGALSPKRQIDRAGQVARDAQKTFGGDETGR